MKTKKFTLLFLAILGCLPSVFSQITGQWRGENRDGIFHAVSFMNNWPENGPSLLWTADHIGEGYSSPVVSGDIVIVNGKTDATGYLFAFNSKGELLWKTPYGSEYPVNDTSSEKFSGPRSTPAIAGELVYICSGMGKISCFNVKNGSEVWSVDMIREFNGLMSGGGYSESLLVDGDRVYCYPGGSEKNVAALDRFTGETIWTSKAMGDSVSYSSPVLINLPERKILVNLTSRYITGLDAGTGELLWYQEQQDLRYNIQYSTPIYKNGAVYFLSDLGGCAVKLQLSEDGKKIKEVWRTHNVRSGLHSPVILNNTLYYSDVRQKIRAIDINNGIITDSLRVFRGPILGSNDRMVCYSENGTVSLINFEDSRLKLVSSFKIEKGTREHLTLPFIDKGLMYIRHGDALMAYDISDDQKQ